MEKIKIIGSEKCEPCKRVKETIEKMKKEDVEYVELTSENLEKLKLPKEALKKQGSLKLPFGVTDKGELCEIYIYEDVILAICKDKIKVICDKELIK